MNIDYTVQLMCGSTLHTHKISLQVVITSVRNKGGYHIGPGDNSSHSDRITKILRKPR